MYADTDAPFMGQTKNFKNKWLACYAGEFGSGVAL